MPQDTQSSCGNNFFMDSLEYLRLASHYPELHVGDFPAGAKVSMITNFTDDVLKKMFIGANLHDNIYPDIYAAPYRQYHFQLKDPSSELYARNSDVTFIFFDINPFKNSDLRSSREYFEELIRDIKRYAEATKGTVIWNSFILSYQTAYGNLFRHSPFFALVEDYNKKLDALAAELPNLIIFDTNRLVHLLGESRTFDTRGTHAFDIPFTNEFMAVLAEEWTAYVRALIGKTKKCIVVDLDNTLWGGVVGELGPLGIALGADYPGSAFVAFQQALLDFYNRGIVLAINSKNNPEDVLEVFKKNPHMVLKEEHFSAIRTNWNDKVENLKEIASELNIGLESMVFLDDDPLNRNMVRGRLPEVAVPEFSIPPEDYVKTLYGLDVFNQFSLTEEDAKKGKMYAEERQRKQVMTNTKSLDEYIKELNIVMRVGVNDLSIVSRLAQLTQKTNQFNLTTKRYAEHDVKKFIADGELVFSANISDKFGDYGTVIEAIVMKDAASDRNAVLDTLLMSCRVMGRGVECAFMDYVVRELGHRGFARLQGEFLPTAKNKPAEAFLTDHGFKKHKNGYLLDIGLYLKNPCSKLNKTITISK
jgi:FkbH-like protein